MGSTRSFTDLPAEIWLLIASYADVDDVLRLKTTCRTLYHLAQEKTLWISYFQRLHNARMIPDFLVYPFASSGAPLSVELSKWPLRSIQHVVTSIVRIDRSWLNARYRSHALISRINSDPRQLANASLLEDSSPTTILSIEVFLDRWLLAVYRESLVELWDLLPSTSRDKQEGPLLNRSSADARCRVRARSHELFNATSCAAALESNGEAILLAITSEPARTTALRLPLQWDTSEPSTQKAEVLCSLVSPSPIHLLRAIHPDSKVLVYSQTQTVSFMNFDNGNRSDLDLSDVEDEFWTGVVSARFLSERQLLIFTTRSVELYAMENTVFDAKQIHWHTSLNATFRGVSHAEPILSYSSSGNPIVSVTFLAYETLRGLFNHEVLIQYPPILDAATNRSIAMEDVVKTAPLGMDVVQVGVHQMAQSIPIPPEGQPSTVRRPRSGFTAGSRGFVSACSIGSHGLRGVWIERQRSSVKRTVYGFNILQVRDTSRAAIREEPHERGLCREDNVQHIEGKCLYEVNSFDLRDDLTHCAFSECTGRIILGTRNGEIHLI
ncbi:hypothetical protein K474DRAFT_1050288 [Panus rudis PR-1116 ss-1]|nr:hypothetical protein K474DRAFT_1050288 [Panus rudis PR-1116 ss-1]